MAITIDNLVFDGPHLNTSALGAKSGVYVILGRSFEGAQWTVVDVGESGDVAFRVGSHDRSHLWKCQGHTMLAVAVYYCDAVQRMKIESLIRARFSPPCGVR